MQQDCDLIVVGSGAGGATLAQACARAGKSVLLLERGRTSAADSAGSEQATLIDKTPYDDRAIDVNGTAKRLYMGGVLGGGTALLWRALLRSCATFSIPARAMAIGCRGRSGIGRSAMTIWSRTTPKRNGSTASREIATRIMARSKNLTTRIGTSRCHYIRSISA